MGDHPKIPIQLERPLVIFDLETTGVDIHNDRIVEFAYLKLFPDGKSEEGVMLVNPEMHIPQRAADIHGITDAKIADEPTFSDLADDILTILEEADLAGYNSDSFDLPLLLKECKRVGAFAGLLQDSKTLDIMRLFQAFHPRARYSLGEALAYLVPNERVNHKAHSAGGDVWATHMVLTKLIERPTLELSKEPTIDELVSIYSTDKAIIARYLMKNEKGEWCFTFGKYSAKNRGGMTVREALMENPGYYDWMVGTGDFPQKVLDILKGELEK